MKEIYRQENVDRVYDKFDQRISHFMLCLDILIWHHIKHITKEDEKRNEMQKVESLEFEITNE